MSQWKNTLLIIYIVGQLIKSKLFPNSGYINGTPSPPIANQNIFKD